MTQTRKLAAILAADVAGYSKLTGADEERTLARLRALRSDLIHPTIAPDPAQGRLRGQGVTARVIVALRDDGIRLPQVGTLMPVDVAASKKTGSVKGLVLGRKPHGPVDTDKVTGIFAPAVWARPMKIVSHRIP